MARHTVRTHKWLNGALQSHDHIFVSLEDAMKFAESLEADVVKVYDHMGQLIHNLKNEKNETYA